jgi:hypothetical protein
MGTTTQPDFDFEHDLPAGVDSFSLHWLAKRWKCSVTHVIHLVEAGEFKVAVDLRNRNSSKACIRLPRAAVVAFLNERKDLAKIAETNPQPKPREKRKRKVRHSKPAARRKAVRS